MKCLIILLIIWACQCKALKLRHNKIGYISNSHEYVGSFMDKSQNGLTVCTNRTNPLAPILRPFCKSELNLDLAPVCRNGGLLPDPVFGCPGHGATEKLTGLTCPKSAAMHIKGICTHGFKPLFIPNARLQAEQGQALLTCRNNSSGHDSTELLEPCDHYLCQNGHPVDPCLGCLDRKQPVCSNQNKLCPRGFSAVILTSPYQCKLPFRCDPNVGESISLKPKSCSKGEFPKCPQEQIRPDDCLLCQDSTLIPNCAGLCPKNYRPVPMPHFFCGNSYQRSINLLSSRKMDRDESFLMNKIDLKSSLPLGHPRLKDDLIGSKNAQQNDIICSYENLEVGTTCQDGVVDMQYCKDGSNPDPCLGCISSSYKCTDNSQICPLGFKAKKSKVPTFCHKYTIGCFDSETKKVSIGQRCENNAVPICSNNLPLFACGCGPNAGPTCHKGKHLCKENQIAFVIPAKEELCY